MPVSGLHGPHPLTGAGVSNNVKGIGAGAYILGYSDKEGFHVQYAGRSDDDLAGRLQQHTPEYYKEFKYGFLSSAKAAFEKECQLFHDFSPQENKIHPARPRGSNWTCPRGCRL
jgi:hypothetical protein